MLSCFCNNAISLQIAISNLLVRQKFKSFSFSVQWIFDLDLLQHLPVIQQWWSVSMRSTESRDTVSFRVHAYK